ncbi:MAG TPA: Cof-type HAD-IIB family hydrolase [Myxococcota bacterium]
MSGAAAFSPKAVYFDLDGTLLDKEARIPPAVFAAIDRLKAKGIFVGIATGRRATTTQPYAEAIGANAPLVLFNGARVVEADFKSMLFSTTLPRTFTRAVIARCLELGIYVGAYVEERLLIDARVPEPRAAGSALSAREVVDLLTLERAAVKLLFVDEPERLLELRRLLTKERLVPPGAHLVRSNPRFLELLPDGVNKGTALHRCAAHLGIDVREIVAVGDDENDREMLENAGLGIAMGHAPDTVKAVADVVIGANDGESLAAKLDDIFA